MNYVDAKNLIESFYRVETLNLTTSEIIVDGMFDDFNSFFIALKEEGDKCYLTDMAKTCELVDISENNLKNMAKNFGLEFDDFYISKEFNDIDDLRNFILFLDKVSKISE